jgi:signal transduction histidine kinase
MSDPRALSPEFLSRAIDQAELEIRKRSLARIPIYFLLFIAIVWLTPVGRRFPGMLAAFGGAVFALSLLRLYLALEFERFHPARKVLWRRLSAAGLYLTAALWGLFCAAVLAHFGLGWVSFFVVLVTCGLTSGETSALAPKFPMLAGYLGMMLIPSLVTNLFIVRGLGGVAIGVFFLGFGAFLVIQGRVQFLEYWARLRENAQLSAMLDAIPGTAAWISSELRYVGVNRRMAEVWGKKREEFIGRKIGFADPQSPLADFARSLFAGGNDSLAAEVVRRIRGEPRRYFVFGEKYSHGTEAILLGIDMTEYAEAERAVVLERAQRLYSSRLANLGEVTSHAQAALSRAEGDVDRSRRIVAALGYLAAPEAEVPGTFKPAEVLADAGALFGGEGARLNLKVAHDCLDAVARGERGRALEALASLVMNSLDAGAPEIEISLERVGGRARMSVTDNGPGIPVELREKVFDPLFTTKPPGKGTGIGLSRAREIAESAGGSLALETAVPRLRMSIWWLLSS